MLEAADFEVVSATYGVHRPKDMSLFQSHFLSQRYCIGKIVRDAKPFY
jgi:hypothetical protein